MTTTDTPPTRQAPDLVGVLLDVAKGREQYAEGAPRDVQRVLLNEAAAYRTAAAIAAGDRSSLPFLLPSWTWAQVDPREPVEPTLRGQVAAAVMAVAREFTAGDVVTITDAVLRVTQEDHRAGIHAAQVAFDKALHAEAIAHLQTIDERDHAQEMADRLAAWVAPEEIRGEHTSGNDPWQNALDWAQADHDADAAAHSAAEPDPDDDERAVEGYHASLDTPWAPSPARIAAVTAQPRYSTVRDASPRVELGTDGVVRIVRADGTTAIGVDPAALPGASIDPIHFDVEEARRQGWSFDPWTSRTAIRVEQARRTTMRDLRRRRRGRANSDGLTGGHLAGGAEAIRVQRERLGATHRVAYAASVLTERRLHARRVR